MTREHRLFVSGLLTITAVFMGCAHPTSGADAAKPPSSASKPAATAPASTPKPGSGVKTTNQWTSMFDGKSLRGWKETDFAGRGDVSVQDGKLILGMGYMTGVTWTGNIPRMNYEVELDAMRVEGSDFFCGLTFPVQEDPCSLIVGGWGGGVVGISSLDGQDAANNETAQYMNFEKGRWYKIRLRVIPDHIQAWIDEERVVDVETSGRKLSIRSEVEPSLPFGVSTWSTTGALRNIRIRKL